MRLTAMLLTREYPEMPITPMRMIQTYRCLTERPDPLPSAAPLPPRVRLSAELNIARGESTRTMLIDGIKMHGIATITQIRDYCASLGRPMSITNARKHLNKLADAGTIERTEDSACLKKAILYWMAGEA